MRGFARDSTGMSKLRPHTFIPESVKSLLNRQISRASLAVFRMGFGAIMVWHLAKLIWPHGWGTMLDFHYFDPDYVFPFVGFEWIRPFPEPFLTIHVWITLLAAVGVAIGLCYRLSTTVLCLGYTYLFLLESADYNNHYYLICLVAFLLIWMPANQLWSLDVWLLRKTGKDAAIEHSEIPFWPVFLLRSQFFILYFFGGIAKMNADWVTGIPLLGPATQLHETVSNWALMPSFVSISTVAIFLAWGGLIYDLTIGFLLIFPRTRLLGIAATFFFHFTNNFLFSIGIFPLLAFTSSLIFFPPNWPYLVMNWLRRPTWNLRTLLGKLKERKGKRVRTKNGRVLKPIVLYFVIGYLLLQVLFPLRHFFIRGDANWSEEGQRFAWRMMLRMKAPGHIIFYVEDEGIQHRRDGRDEVDPQLWPFEGAGVIYVPIVSSRYSWEQHPGLTVIFEPSLGRRVIFGVEGDVEKAKESIRKTWNTIYGREPDSIVQTTTIPDAVAAIRKETSPGSEEIEGLLEEIGGFAELETENAPAESKRQLALTDALERLFHSNSQDVAPLRSIHPFALQGAPPPNRSLLVVNDSLITVENEAKELGRLTVDSGYLVWLDLEQMRPRDWRKLPRQFVVFERGKLNVLWNPFQELNWQQTERLANRPHMIWLYARHIAEVWEQQTSRKPAVFASTHVSLNFRLAAPVVDPKADLAKVSYSLFRHNDWITDVQGDLPKWSQMHVSDSKGEKRRKSKESD